MAMRQKNLPDVVPEVFEHEQFGQLRWFMIGDAPWFVAMDVCRALELGNTGQALAKLDDDEKGSIILNDRTSAKGGSPIRSIVNEFGLYSLILSSRKPAAKKFKRWVTHEVLPSIRKYGYYSVAKKENLIEQPHFETDEEWFEYYELLKRQVPYMSDEEVMKLSEDPDILVYKKTRLTKEEILEWSKNPDAFNHKKNDSKWQVRFLLV